MPLPLSDVAIGICSFSASSTTSRCACELTDAAACNDDRIGRSGKNRCRFAHTVGFGLGTKRRHTGELLLDYRLGIEITERHVRSASLESQMHRVPACRMSRS